MSSISCQLDETLIQKVKKLRFLKNPGNCSYLIFKINRQKKSIELDEEAIDSSFEELSESLDEDSPRFVVLSYKQELNDGRVKFPFILIHYNPPGVSPELNMLFSTSRQTFMKVTDLNRVLELQDNEELNITWVNEALAI